jgi:hypothetical protein
MYVVLKTAYLYDFITKLCVNAKEVIETHVNENNPNSKEGKDQRRKHEAFKLCRCERVCKSG